MCTYDYVHYCTVGYGVSISGVKYYLDFSNKIRGKLI